MPQGRRLRALLLTIVLGGVALAAPVSAGAAPTVVSLTFDDGWDNQQTASSMLTAHGMVGTFYVNSQTIGQPGYLSWTQLATSNANGNEIAGHTLTHPDLTTLTATQAKNEICQDRQNILAHGFVVPDFAYPFGAYDVNTGSGSLDVSSIVRDCGYASGRGAFGLRNIVATNDTRPYATTIPPPNLYKIKTPCCINHQQFGGSTPTAAALEDYVTHAETGGGGWVNFVFHRLCDNCGDDAPAPSMSPSEFDAFLDWLRPRAASGTVVRTVAQVVKNDTQAPSTSIACGGAACSTGWYGGPVSMTLSATETGTAGVAMIRYTTDGSEPTAASPAYTGPFTVSATTTVKYRAWDNANNVEPVKSQLVQVDATAPVSSIACNGSACAGTDYEGPVTVALAATDDESGVAAIRYTVDGSDPTTASPLYGGPFTVSETTTVRYRAWDASGNVEAVRSQLVEIVAPPPQDTIAPTSAIACNGTACSAWYAGPVSVKLSATDDASGVAAIRYTLDGSTPTASSQLYTGPFTVSQTTTVRYRAWDNAGNVEAAKSQLVRIDTVAPTVVITAPANGAAVKGVVKVTANAGDAGSGVATVSFYANGVLIGSKAGGGTVFVSWNTGKLKGQYTLTAVAKDVAGNSTTSAAVTVTAG
jgi:peptidoglycan/xylan/chitin deacetylase (PgdA/CDA1 family)